MLNHIKTVKKIKKIKKLHLKYFMSVPNTCFRFSKENSKAQFSYLPDRGATNSYYTVSSATS